MCICIRKEGQPSFFLTQNETILIKIRISSKPSNKTNQWQTQIYNVQTASASQWMTTLKKTG